MIALQRTKTLLCESPLNGQLVTKPQLGNVNGELT